MEILEHSALSPEGVAWNYIFNDNKGQFDKLTALKLERRGLIARKIVADQNNEEYYLVSLSADGRDYLLDNEQELRRNITSAGTTPDSDEIPF